MKAIHIALAAASLLVLGAPQASEITDFPMPATSMVTRAEVLAEALAGENDHARYDFIGPTVTPMSTKSREEVRWEAISSNRDRSVAASADSVGGM